MATIMVVDDYPITQRVLSHHLCKKGHHVVVASNGREALDSLDQTGVELMIVDLVMPETDSLSLLAHLRRDARYTHIRVIVLTANGRPGDGQQMLDSGADALFTRPASHWDLANLVSELLSPN